MIFNIIKGVQVPAAAISALSSLFLASIIPRTEQITPYRRLVFGICVGDILQSGSLLVAPFIINPDPVTGTISNQLTCDIQASIFISGCLIHIQYTMGLCLFYIMVVKHNITDQAFSKAYERKIHVGALVSPIPLLILMILTENINPLPDGQLCFVNSAPLGCKGDPDIDCTRGENAFIYGMLAALAPYILCIIGIVTLLTKLVFHVVALERRANNRFQSSFTGVVDGRADDVTAGSGARQSFYAAMGVFRNAIAAVRDAFNEDDSSVNGPRNYRTRGAQRARQRTIETAKQALLYASVFLLLAPHPMIGVAAYYWHGRVPPEGYSIFFHFLFPLNGILNLLVFTRPHVRTVMKRRPRFYRIQALWRVLVAGGEVPTDIPPLPSRASRASGSRGSTREEDVDDDRNRLCQLISRLFSINEDGLVAGPFRQLHAFLKKRFKQNDDNLSDLHSFDQADLVPKINEVGLNVQSDPTSDVEHPHPKRISASEMSRRISIAALDRSELLQLQGDHYSDDDCENEESQFVAQPKDATKDANPKCMLPSALREGEEDSNVAESRSDEKDINTKNERQSTDSISSDV